MPTATAFRVRIFVTFIETVIAITILLSLSFFLVRHFDTTWDVLAYHLGFSALRGNVPNANTFVFVGQLFARYQGFPPLVDYLVGGLWRISHRPETGNLINPLAILVLATYVHRYFHVSMLWSVLLFAGIPALHTEIASQYVDLWTNSFFSLFLFSSFVFLYRGYEKKHLIIALLALGVAANSKPQFIVIGGLGAACFVICSILRLFDRSDARYPLGFVAAVLVIGLPIVFASALINLIRFGNPVYPVIVRIAGHQLAGTEDVTQDGGPGPADLRYAPYWEKWGLSMLEYRALSLRPGGYSLGQGDVQAGIESDRMGGSAIFLLIPALAALFTGLVKEPLRYTLPPITVGAILSVAVALIPASFDLRYFTFIEIVLVIGAFSVVQAMRDRGDLYAAGVLAILKSSVIGAALFVSFVTGFRFVHPSNTDVAAVTKSVRPELEHALQKGSVICYAKADPMAILYSKLLNSDLSQDYTVISSYGAPDGCPPDSVVIK